MAELSTIKLSSVLSNEFNITQRVTDIVYKDVSSYNRVWIKNFDDNNLSNGEYSDLSVIKLPLAEYMELLSGDTPKIDPRTIYVVSSDHIESFGQVISNATMTNDTVPSEVVTEHYLSSKISSINNIMPEISGVGEESTFSELISAFIKIRDALSSFSR